MGQTQATTEAIWLKKLLSQLLRPNNSDLKAKVFFGDNQGAVAPAKTAQFHARFKHIDIAHHFVRVKVNDGTVDLQYTLGKVVAFREV